MRVGILTFHRTTNYGAILQTYALQYVLNSMGISTEVIDYRCKAIEERYEKNKLIAFFSIRNLIKIILKNSYIRDNRMSFTDFLHEYIKVSDQTYFDLSTNSEINEYYDCFIVGSDQVWNGECTGWDTSFFLGFTEKNKRNAYAASFGFSRIPSEKYSWYKQNFPLFCNISVREKSGCEIIENLTHQNSVTVLDPTLLLHEEWNVLINEKIDDKEQYILVYLMKETNSLFKAAGRLSKISGYKIIYINDRLFGRFGVDNRYYVSPCDWVGLFRNASYVLTNSFHGTAFAINFNIPFWTELLPSPSKVNERLTNLLSICDLNNRILVPESVLDEKISFDRANLVINEMREYSVNYLKQIVISS